MEKLDILVFEQIKVETVNQNEWIEHLTLKTPIKFIIIGSNKAVGVFALINGEEKHLGNLPSIVAENIKEHMKWGSKIQNLKIQNLHAEVMEYVGDLYKIGLYWEVSLQKKEKTKIEVPQLDKNKYKFNEKVTFTRDELLDLIEIKLNQLEQEVNDLKTEYGKQSFGEITTYNKQNFHYGLDLKDIETISLYWGPFYEWLSGLNIQITKRKYPHQVDFSHHIYTYYFSIPTNGVSGNLKKNFMFIKNMTEIELELTEKLLEGNISNKFLDNTLSYSTSNSNSKRDSNWLKMMTILEYQSYHIYDNEQEWEMDLEKYLSEEYSTEESRKKYEVEDRETAKKHSIKLKNGQILSLIGTIEDVIRERW